VFAQKWTKCPPIPSVSFNPFSLKEIAELASNSLQTPEINTFTGKTATWPLELAKKLPITILVP
jgi:hypothetical protein